MADSKDFQRAVYVISVAAELAGVHPQTLRIYERKGLLDPARTVGGSRRYSEYDIHQLQRIQELTNEGLNLAGVKRVLELEAELERAQRELTQAKEQASAAIDQTAASRSNSPSKGSSLARSARCWPNSAVQASRT